MPFEFRVVLVEQVDAIRHPDHNHQRRDESHEPRELVTEQHDAAQRPNHAGTHHQHAHRHHDDVAEEKQEEQGRHNGCQAYEQAQLALDLGGDLRADVGQARHVDVHPRAFLEPLHLLHKELHRASAVFGVEEGRIDIDHLYGRPSIGVKESLVEGHAPQSGNGAVQFGLGFRAPLEHRFHDEGLGLILSHQLNRGSESKDTVNHTDLPGGAIGPETVNGHPDCPQGRFEVPPLLEDP